MRYIEKILLSTTSKLDALYFLENFFTSSTRNSWEVPALTPQHRSWTSSSQNLIWRRISLESEFWTVYFKFSLMKSCAKISKNWDPLLKRIFRYIQHEFLFWGGGPASSPLQTSFSAANLATSRVIKLCETDAIPGLYFRLFSYLHHSFYVIFSITQTVAPFLWWIARVTPSFFTFKLIHSLFVFPNVLFQNFFLQKVLLLCKGDIKWMQRNVSHSMRFYEATFAC